MNLVDVFIVVSALIAVGQGWRLGIIRGVFGLAGLIVGAWIAFHAVPIAFDIYTPATWLRVLSSIGIITALALLGESVGSAAGAVIRKAITWSPIRFIDSVLGSAFRFTSLTVVIWLLTSALALLPDRGVIHQVRTSEIVSIIDSYAPDAADRASAALRTAMGSAHFPVVFAGVTPQPRHTVAPADPALLTNPQVVAAFASVYKVEATSDACFERMSGSGFVFAHDRIMTNAHVVAGADEIVVWAMGDATPRSATIVYIDPKLDVAVLAVQDLATVPLEFGPDAQVGDEGVVPGFTGGDPMTPDPARVSDTLLARGHDIYGVTRVDREILVLRSAIAAGDSGAPVVDAHGRVLGMVFAAGTDLPDTGYALTIPALGKAASIGRDAYHAVATGRCVA